MEKKIIGIDASNISEGGGERHLFELLEKIELSNTQIKEIIIWCKKSLKKNLPKKSFINYVSEPLIEKNIFLRNFWKLFFLKKSFNKYKCNLLFVPTGYSFFFPKLTIILNQNILPFEKNEVNKINNVLFKIKIVILKYLNIYSINKASGNIFLSKHAYFLIKKHCTKIKNYKIISHGIDKIFLNVKKKNFSTYNKDKTFRLLYVSSFYEYKNHIKLIKVINELINEGFNISLTMVGRQNRYFSRHILPFCKSIENNENFQFINFIPMNEMPNIYPSYNLFVFPSTCENLPNILLEAIASGIPIISSNYGPMRDIIKNPDQLFDPNNHNDLKCKIIKILNLKNFNDILIKLDLEKKYSWDITSIKTMSYFESLL